jgi:hypothetical protein
MFCQACVAGEQSSGLKWVHLGISTLLKKTKEDGSIGNLSRLYLGEVQLWIQLSWLKFVVVFVDSCTPEDDLLGRNMKCQ